MGFTDKMCYDVAKEIINNVFMEKYKPTIKDNKTWYENLNKFVVEEWNRLKDTDDKETEFTEEEEDMIVHDSMDLLLTNLEISEDDFEEYEQEVDWGRFDEIISHYISNV
tara:strand:- start:977 stop:1306 length:330 start_codon:yes stop_codon:yes gene_type:complete